METFIIYFLKANLVLSILFLVFWLFLKGEKFFLLNRAILLGIIFLSLLLPVAPSLQNFGIGTNTLYQTDYSEFIGFGNRIKVPINDIKAGGNDNILKVDTASITIKKQVSLTSVVFFVYLLISTVLLLRFLTQLIRLFKILRCSEQRKEGVINFCNSKADLTPFSFFNYLVINDIKYNKTQMNQIVEHEKVHIKQWHTLDILFAEVFHIIFWINPLVQLLKQHVKLNLEYIADQEVLNNGVDTKSYQLNILHSCLNPATVPLTNLFISSKIKLRIKMMNTKKSPLYNMYKYAFVLPLIVLMYFVVNTANAKNESDVSLISRADFMAYEGYYKFQFQPGKDVYIKILTKNGRLVLSEQWSGKEIIFEQKSELEFYNKSDAFPLKFTKNKEGVITQVLAFNRDLWKKDNDYKPKARPDVVEVLPDMKIFEGYYQLTDKKEVVVKVVLNGNDLIIKNQWDGAESTYSPESPLVFYNKSGDQSATIKFARDSKGNIISGTDIGGGTWNKVNDYTPHQEIKLTAMQLKAYEGKYTFEFKPGKSETITIMVNDGGLTLKEGWSGAEINFVPESEVDFFSKQKPFPLKFTKDAAGNVTHVLAHNKDLWSKVK